MVASKHTRVAIEDVDGTQHFDNAFFQTSDILRLLAKLFRQACGIDPLDPATRITEGEAQMIFTLCYVCHYGSDANWTTRAERSLKDLYEYADPQRNHALPYYVVRTYHRAQESGALDTTFSPKMMELYKLVVAIMSGPVADYEALDTHSLPPQ